MKEKRPIWNGEVFTKFDARLLCVQDENFNRIFCMEMRS